MTLQDDNSERAAEAAAKEPKSEVDGTAEQKTASSAGKGHSFVEHLVVATVADYIEGDIVEDLTCELNAAMSIDGILATHIGRCEAFLGESTFMIHIRAVDTAACDAAHRAVAEVYGKHLTPNKKRSAEGFENVVIIDFNSVVYGASDDNWPAIRIAIWRYKPNSDEEKKASLIRHLPLLPTLFPSVKQVSWGRNIAKEKAYTNFYGYADVDHEIAVILGFDSSQEMHALGANPRYWELLNHHGVSLLEKYQVLTFCDS